MSWEKILRLDDSRVLSCEFQRAQLTCGTCVIIRVYVCVCAKLLKNKIREIKTKGASEDFVRAKSS